jgi:hypothetical protein
MSDKLSGFLVWSEPSALRSALPRLTRLTREVEAIEGWHRYDYEVREQIPGLEIQGSPPFTHQLLIKWGGDRLIVLSNHYRVCDHFIDVDLRPALATFFKKADIAVHELVLAMIQYRDYVKQPLRQDEDDSTPPPPPNMEAAADWPGFNNYHMLGYASARTDAFGGSLQRIEFEGDDLASVSLFTAAIPLVRFRNCGLRRKMSGEHGFPGTFELLRLGRTGFLSFVSPASPRGQKERLKEVEGLLRSLNRFGFIK